MNYQWHYERLIETRMDRVFPDDVYVEKHHIIPSSMGGMNGPTVYLTAREHFIAHWLLWRIYRNREMAFAFRCMCFYKNNKMQGKCRVFSSRAYSESKEAVRVLGVSANSKIKQSKAMSGKKRKPFTTQHKENISRAAKNRANISDETRKKLSLSHVGKKHSIETLKKIGDAHRGKFVSDETRRKISEANSKRTGIKYKKNG